jgi:hypothetical protein
VSARRSTSVSEFALVRHRTTYALALILACAAVWTSPTALTAAAVPRIALTVRVYQTAGLAFTLEQRALTEAQTVLRAGLVEVRWQECTGLNASPICDVPPGHLLMPFCGNPARVCLLQEPRDDRWMQNVAREMNLADTAFLQRRADGFDLRWFTPSVEVDLCGHATLASAHILTETGELPPDKQARFHTRSGLLTAVRRGEWIELDFPGRRQNPSKPAGSHTVNRSAAARRGEDPIRLPGRDRGQADAADAGTRSQAPADRSRARCDRDEPRVDRWSRLRVPLPCAAVRD